MGIAYMGCTSMGRAHALQSRGATSGLLRCPTCTQALTVRGFVFLEPLISADKQHGKLPLRQPGSHVFKPKLFAKLPNGWVGNQGVRVDRQSGCRWPFLCRPFPCVVEVIVGGWG